VTGTEVASGRIDWTNGDYTCGWLPVPRDVPSGRALHGHRRCCDARRLREGASAFVRRVPVL